MSALALVTAGILLVASPNVTTVPSTFTSAKQTDAVWIAAHGGFLVGSAHRCGIDNDRVVKAGQIVQILIAAAAADDDEASDAGNRFAEFFLATAYPDKAKSLTISCKTVAAELGKLEQHQTQAAQAVAPKDSTVAAGNSPAPNFRLSDGE